MRNRLVAVLLFCSTITNAQVWNGDLIFRSQAEIDDFTNFSYTSVSGYLIINDQMDGQHDIRNLAGLASITAVTNGLTVSNCNLLTNTAFLNVTSVGTLQIANNPALTTINGLPLTSVTESVTITNNASLTAITALNTLTEVPEILNIMDNPALTNLDGFGNLQKAKALGLRNNISLTNVDGFAKLAEIHTLSLVDLSALNNIDGLNALKIASNVAIVNCSSLTDINGLSNLTVVGDVINIANNNSLQNVEGLSSLTGRSTIIVSNNNALENIFVQRGPTHLNLFILQNPALKHISGFANARSASLEIINNHVLETMTGLHNVEVAGQITLQHNWELKAANILPQVRVMNRFLSDRNYILSDIGSMPLLDTVLSDFTIVTDTMLTNLDFLSGLRFVGGTLRISSVEKLASIDGLSNLDSVGKDILISLFYSPTVNALSKIEYISGTLELRAGYELESLVGLHNLKSVGMDLILGSSLKLTNLDALENLKSVGTLLSITNLFKLTNLYGLRNLRSATHVVITNNPLLTSFCGLYELFTHAPPTGVVQIALNQVNPTANDIRNGGPCSTLPVHFLVFNLKCADNKISLNWVTSNEVDNSHFIVQRSNNGTAWTDLGLVSAAGNNGGVTKYAFSDDQPIANAYYRLAQVDLDRKIHYSSVIRAACAADTRYTVWPNPATSKVLVSIRSGNASSGILKLADSKGSIILSKKIVLLPGQNQIEFNISGIPKGIYFLQAIYNGNREQQRTVLLKN